MNHPVTISVLMAVYNTDFHLVKRAVDSVLNQTFQDFELIILDDGSNFDSSHAIFTYATKQEARITYLRHKNCGQSQSINQGVRLSKGAYITILDSDDEYKPGHLQSCLQEMQFSDLIASTTETIVDHEEHYFVPNRHDTRQLIHVDDCILFATLFGKKEVFSEFAFQGEYAADAHFYERAMQKYIVRKVDLRTYVYYRNIPNSVCSNMLRNQLQHKVEPN